MATHKLLLLAGDGIGPEVMAEVKRLLGFLAKAGIATFETEEGLVGGAATMRTRSPSPRTPWRRRTPPTPSFSARSAGRNGTMCRYDVRPEAGLLRLRKDLGLFANIRPAICYPALADASSLKREVVEGLDIIILRELTGGVYFGEPKTITDLGNGQKRAVDTQVYDTYEIERIARVGFELARKRRNKVTSMEKRNVMKTGVLWHEVVDRRARARIQGRAARAHAGRRRRHAAGALAEAVRRHRHRQSVRRHAVGHRRDADRLARHAAVGLARRGRCQDQAAQGALRAGARLGARHRRQGHRQSDRHAGVVRHGAALFVQHGQGSRPASMPRSPPTLAKGLRTADIKSEGTQGRQHLRDGRGDRRRAGTAHGTKH